MMAITSKQVEIGDFISIPTWNTWGQVIAVESAWYGSDSARRILLQERPEAAGKWYQVEPSEFQLMFSADELSELN